MSLRFWETYVGTKLVIFFTTIILFCSLFISYLIFETEKNTLEENTIEHLTSVAILKERAVNRWFEEEEEDIVSLTKSPLIIENCILLVENKGNQLNTTSVYESLRNFLTEYLTDDDFHEFFIMDKEGVIIVSTDPNQEGKFKSNRLYFIEGKKNSYIQNVYHSMTLGVPAVTISAPLRDNDGDVIGVIAGRANLGQLNDILGDRSGLGKTGETYLVNKYNFFVTESRFEKGSALNKSIYTKGVKECLKHKSGAGVYDNYHGAPVLGYYLWMEERELCLLAEIEQSEAFAPVYNLQLEILKIFIIIVAVSILLGIFLSTKITKPIKILIRGTAKIGKGDLNYKVRLKSKDEIGQLAASFNKMTDNLRRTVVSKEYFDSILKSMVDTLIVVSPDEKIESVNKATVELLGYEEKELIGRPVDTIILPPETETGKVTIFRGEGNGKLRAKDSKDIEVNYKSKENRKIPMNLSCSMIKGDEGKIQGIVYIGKDITERRRAEEKLKETMDELARSNAELEHFAYIASHDLQEPLRMVNSYLKLLERRYKGQLDKDANEFIGYAVDGGTRMQRLINDLLTYSRVGTKGKPFESTDLELVYNQTLSNLKLAIEETGAVITHDSLPTVMVDSSQLLQLFQNLIGNSIKFRGEEPPQVNVGAEERGNEWIFSVKDNGIGIDPKHSERIFQIFQRLHTRDEYSGTGIGLAISKKIVERHGGRIWVESEPGKGSTFYFMIPNNGGVRS